MAADLMAPVAWLLPLLAMQPQAQWLPPPPPPPPASELRPGPQPLAPRQGLSGRSLQINGAVQQARWLLTGPVASPSELWLPLEVLQNQLGVASQSDSSGTLKLEWFGRELVVAGSNQRSLDDEVAVESVGLLQAAGMRIGLRDGVLTLDLPPPRLLAVRSAAKGSQRRVVLDLDGPALIRREGSAISLGLRSDPAQVSSLRGLGLVGELSPAGLSLQVAASPAQRLFSLGDPARIVIDLATPNSANPDSASEGPSPQASDPRLLALLGQGLEWDRQLKGSVRLNAVRLDPRTSSLTLRPLTRGGGMEGLSSLQQLASQDDALVAINGGYFNRVKRLPLGALKSDGRWLSGPILGRGVVAWSAGSLPRFGRLSLAESVSDGQGNRQVIVTLNSGYVQRGLSRYTADWGATYRALSGEESALVLSTGRVQAVYDHEQLEQGVPLRPGETLLVARGGSSLPWTVGDRLQLSSSPSNDLGDAPFVIGGGPLLLQAGRIVLNGAQENFSSGFLRQGAPRTVIASDGRQLWLITLEGSSDSGPSLGEAAALLQQMGLQDALNLDGGSSTGLVMGGVMTVKGRGVVGSVHHGLGLVPRLSSGSAGRMGSSRLAPTSARVRSPMASTPSAQP